MTFEELLKYCACGEMPSVIWNGVTGRVVAIKSNDVYKGCAVRFDKPYDEWFWAEKGTDKRRKYMAELNITV